MTDERAQKHNGQQLRCCADRRAERAAALLGKIVQNALHALAEVRVRGRHAAKRVGHAVRHGRGKAGCVHDVLRRRRQAEQRAKQQQKRDFPQVYPSSSVETSASTASISGSAQ